MRILTVTTLYPNIEFPNHGVFVENRLRQLVKTGRVAATVVAPVPWFPFGSRVFKTYGDMARIPASELRHGLRVDSSPVCCCAKAGHVCGAISAVSSA